MNNSFIMCPEHLGKHLQAHEDPLRKDRGAGNRGRGGPGAVGGVGGRKPRPRAGRGGDRPALCGPAGAGSGRLHGVGARQI